MTTPLQFIIADNNTNGILTLHENLVKDFSSKLRYTHNIEQLEEEITRNDTAILFYDLDFLDAENAINVLSELRNHVPNLTILPIVSRQNTKLIRELVALQLFFYITTPLDYKDIKITIRRALETHFLNNSPSPTLENENSNTSNDDDGFEGILGKSSSMLKLFDVVKKVSEDDFSTVLIRGESGTGKEMVAKAIHQCSPRRKKNFVPVNCAAIPDELLESELFGYTKGAFTGATGNKLGRIQYADKGTLFLDEIGDMKPSLQAKLLRVLQEREFEPVGGFKTTSVDTRVLAATHCDLEDLVKKGLFREDLYYRLSVIPIIIPPLRKRKEDIPLLVEKFIHNHTTKRARLSFSFSQNALKVLSEYDWHGNVRELENLIQHMSVLHAGNVIHCKDLPSRICQNSTIDLQTTFSEPHSISFASNETYNEQDLLWGDIDNEDSSISEKSFFDTESTRPDFGDFTNDIDIHDDSGGENIDCIEIQWGEAGIDFNELVGSFENKLIITALQKSSGNKKEAATLLGLKRTTLLEKIKKKGLQGCWKQLDESILE